MIPVKIQEPLCGNLTRTQFPTTMRNGGWVRGFFLNFLFVLTVSMAMAENRAGGDGEKRVEINQTHQVLRAYEGGQLVIESRVSTGRNHWTPNGTYRVQAKHRMHYSRIYDNAPMPYSVQVHGNYFIHGFTHVPDHPASKGCIRLPMTNGNPAREFFEWVELGTVVVITGRWEG